LASPFDPRACGKKTTTAAKARLAQMLPLMAFTPPVSQFPNPFGNRCDQSATISKLSDHGFESLTTRLRPGSNAGQNWKLEV
jgi:hypothetical protein